MVVGVLVELSNKKVDKIFSYRVPSDLESSIKIGIRVLVPFASLTLEGFILEIKNDYDDDLKDVIKILDDEPILNDELIYLGRKMSEDTLSTLISCYQAMLPRALKAKVKNNIGIKMNYFVSLNDNIDYSKLSDKQRKVVDILESGPKLYSEVKKINSSIDTLIKNGFVIKEKKEVYRLIDDNQGGYVPKILTHDQMACVDRVTLSLNKHEKFLLHGVTGSGKTAVYMEIISKVLENGRDAILLLPEISLTPQIVKRFKNRFHDNIAVLHSGLSDGERYDEYRKIVNGHIRIVIGARSAVFAPLKHLGVIIIDECHSSSYRQDNMPKYDALTIASIRGEYHNIPVVLGSATPTVSLYARALRGIYTLLNLDKRIGNSSLPKINIVDMNYAKRVSKTNFSYELVSKIEEKLKLKEQIILFLNRRGYTNLISCHDCGYVFKCPHCDISLIYHKTKNILRCHYCGYATNYKTSCPNCHHDNIHDIGLGTEKVEEELKTLFKDARIVRMDLDTTTRKGSSERIIHDFENGYYDILLGTQMIAKGLDFSNVTLVGVINIDNLLAIPSYKSAENTFNLLTQVSGRAGRGSKRGEVIIQTFNKDHYAIQTSCKNDYLSFYKQEMLIRKSGFYPPYYYLVNIMIKAKDYNILNMETNKIMSVLNKNLLHSVILGPTMAYPYKLMNVFRLNILIKYQKEAKLYPILKEIDEHYRNNAKVLVEFSFNPLDV